MRILRIPYSTWKSVLDANLDWIVYQENDGQARYVWAGNLDYVFTTIVKQEDRPDYDAWDDDRTVVSVENEEDAIAHLVGIGEIVSLRSVRGLVGSSPAKGLGGFAPDPSTNPYEPASEEVVSHYTDGWGQLMTRGPTFTDEGSFRDDFTGSELETDLTGTLSFTNGSMEVTGSGTLFTSELNRNHYVKVISGTGFEDWARVVRAPSDTLLLLEGPYQGTTSSGTAHKTKWVAATSGGTPGTYSVGSSEATLSSGTGTNGTIRLYREGDYLPCLAVWKVEVSQRIANQTVHFGFRDDYASPGMYAEVILTGTNNTLVTFRTAWESDEESSTVSLPAGLTTAMSLRYKIDVAATHCTLLVNGVPIAKHENHVPDPYASFTICCGVVNSGSVTNTTVTIDSVYFANTNNLQVSSMFSEPMPVVTSENQHTLATTLTTTSTSSNQTVISYTVPAGRVFYVIGYMMDAQGTSNGVFKIGRNSVTSEPASPGELDGNIFRSRYLPANGSYDEEFGSNPRKLGVGGDTILVTISPDGILSTKWRCSLDFVLR